MTRYLGLFGLALWASLGLLAGSAQAKPEDGRLEWRIESTPVKERTWRHDGLVLAVAFSPDGRRVLTGSTDKTAVLRDARTGQTLHTWRHDGSVLAVAFSPDGRRVLTGSVDKTAVLRDTETGKPLHTWQHGKTVFAVAFSPDGRRGLTGVGNLFGPGDAVLRNTNTGETLHTWQHDNQVTAVAFSPNGRRVLTGSVDKTVVLRDADTGEPLHTWRHDNNVRAVAFSPDGRRVLTGSADNTAVLRDAETGQTLHTWRHDNDVTAVAFSPDGRRVLTGSTDKIAVLRDAETGEPLHTWRHDNDVRAVAFSPDGRRVLTGSNDKTAVLRVVPLPLAESVGLALQAAEQTHRVLSTALTQRRTDLEARKPAAKDEFETQAQYSARVAEWNTAVKRLHQESDAHYAKLGPLPLSARARAMQKAVADAYGDPVLEDLRYDAEVEKFFATLKASDDPTVKRTVVIAVPNSEARAAKAALEKDSGALSVQMRVNAQNELFWEGATVTLNGKTRVAQFTDKEFVPAVTTVATSTPALANLAQESPLAPLSVAEVRVSDDPKLAKLQREVLERERNQAQQAAREAEERRLKERLAQLNASQTGSFEDDLTSLLQPKTPAPVDPRLHVLVIGIHDYADVPDVPFADRSADAFAKLAKAVLGAAPQNVLRLTDADATSGRLRGRIKTLLNRLGAKDRLLVYYAGHGVPSQDGKAAYLLAQDGGPGSFEEPDLQLDNLYAAIEQSRVGQASLFIDACFSGRSGKDSIVFEGIGGITLIPKNTLKPNGRVTVLTAGRAHQFSNWNKTRGHRLFGYHLMKVLLEDGTRLSAEQLHAKLRDRVLDDSRRLGPEFEQEPELLGNGKAVIGTSENRGLR